MILLRTGFKPITMRIDKIQIQNFRGIEDLKFDLHPHFNLLIGENGSGKTAILEAMAVGIGAFFSGMPGVNSRHIRDADLRYFKTPEGSFEYELKTRVDVKGRFDKEPINWYKEREGIHGSNKMGNRSQIRAISDDINKAIRDSKRINLLDLPVLAYYSTARLWKEGRENKKEVEKEKKVKNLPSRYRGYKDALEIKSTFSIMLDWFKGKFLDKAANDETSFQLDCVKEVIIKNIPTAKNIKWVFDKDKIQTLYIVFENKTEVPFHFLSDGYRNLLAIFADLAYRCVTLNPHFGKEANLKSEGVVLIDELDLHLHPAWQQDIVKKLKKSFPKIQFVATTHSPFILQEMEDNEVYKINSSADKILYPLKGLNRLSVEDIAEDVQGVETPNMSSKREEMFKAAEDYYKLLDSAEKENNKDRLQELKDKMDAISEKYSDDVAYYAFLKQERLARGIK
jgi:predicted ATP-binding protein involved in virulence